MPKMQILYDDVLEQVRYALLTAENREYRNDTPIRSPNRVLHSLYGAMLVVGQTVALRKLPTALTTLTEDIGGTLTTYNLPADRFQYRDDAGLVNITLTDSAGVLRDYSVLEAVSKDAVRKANQNPWQYENPMFHVDYPAGTINIVQADKYQLKYVKLFTAPTLGTLGSQDFPMLEPYDRTVVDLATKHILEIVARSNRNPASGEALAVDNMIKSEMMEAVDESN